MTSEMSAFQAACSKAHVGGKHEALQRGRRGADDEDPGSNPASLGQKDSVVGTGGFEEVSQDGESRSGIGKMMEHPNSSIKWNLRSIPPKA